MNKRLTTKCFIQRAKEKHGDKFSYKETIYEKSNVKIKIICLKHDFEFEQYPNNHINGKGGCKKCMIEDRTTTTEEFILKANKVHNNFYNYSKSLYTKISEKISITCQIHGDFNQLAGDHLQGSGCNNCKKDKLRNSVDFFIEKARLIHSNIYKYDKVVYITGSEKVIITCKKHGDFKQRPFSHLNRQGCPQCGKNLRIKSITKTTEQFIKEAKEVHGDKYNYENTNYTNSKKKVIITCKHHGDFKQKAGSHLEGMGCSKCGMQSNFKRTEYIERAKGRTCIFYTIRCFNEEEEFYKIGITMKTVSERYATKLKLPYDYEVVTEIHGNAEYVWNLEKEEKAKLKSFNYQPKTKFCGSKTECFTKY